MKRLFIAVLFTCLTAHEVFAAQELVGDELQFPYEALVLRDDAPVRSGPGTVHYATDKLSAGTVLEVHRHDPGGWCAIRPPAGSFSLIPESAIEFVEDNVGRVVAGSAQTWVGTRLGVVENPLWQVKLRKNELVEILGEVSWPNPEGHSTIWYQISPPAGEFRWIQISDLQLPDDSTRLPSLSQPQSFTQQSDLLDSPPSTVNPAGTQMLMSNPARIAESPAPTIIPQTQTTLTPANAAPPILATPIKDVNVQPAILQTNVQYDSMPDTSAKSINSGWRPASRKNNRNSAIGKHISNQPPNQFTAPAIPSLGTSSTINQFADSRSDFGQDQHSSAARVASANMEYNATMQPAPLEADAMRLPTSSEFGDSSAPIDLNVVHSKSIRMNQLEMALTNEMLKQPSSWRLDDLLLQTEAAIETSTDPTVTQHGNRLLEKIRRCQSIRSKYRSNYNDDPMANTGNNVSLKGPVGTGVDTEVEFGATYDAYGWLNELVRDSGSSPSTYVLQDENGKITHHITGAPGMNLHRYLKSRVGVVGQRGYHQALNLDHVTAERIVELRQRR